MELEKTYVLLESQVEYGIREDLCFTGDSSRIWNQRRLMFYLNLNQKKELKKICVLLEIQVKDGIREDLCFT